MCTAHCLSMKQNETIRTDPPSSDEEDEPQLSEDFCIHCRYDPCIYLGFHEEFMKTPTFTRMIDRITSREADKGHYMGLKNYIVCFQIVRKFKMWRRDNKQLPVPRCVKDAIVGMYPFETRREYIYLTAAHHIMYSKAYKEDGSVCRGYFWQRQPNWEWFLVDTNGTKIYPENYPENMVPVKD